MTLPRLTKHLDLEFRLLDSFVSQTFLNHHLSGKKGLGFGVLAVSPAYSLKHESVENNRGWGTSLLLILSLSGCGQHINYEALKTKVEARRVELNRAYCNDDLNKDSVIKVAQHYLLSTMVAKMFPAWYGTRWDYNGTTQCPKKGKIACGYFVTTTMRDMGFNIPRVRWAQAPSETMIKQMTSSGNIKRYRFSSIDHIKKEVRKWGEGIYVVGMDSHGLHREP